MQQIILGNSSSSNGNGGVRLSRIGLGCMGMSDFYGASDDEANVPLLHQAIDLGINLFDTADVYGTGHNEILLSRVLRARRSEVVIATKFGNVRNVAMEWIGVNGKPSYVKAACHASLKRLNIDHIDLYYQHRVDPETPIEETVGAMAELVKEGKVRFIGLSEAAPATIRRAHAVHPISALQTEYSLWSRDPERELLEACRELGITFVAYSPLGRGFLSGHFRKPDDLGASDTRRNIPRFQGENFYKNLQLVDQVKEIAAEKGVTPSQLAIAWVIAHGSHILPIPGTRSLERLKENISALEITFTPDELARLDAIFPPDAAAGTRYAEQAMKRVNL